LDDRAPQRLQVDGEAVHIPRTEFGHVGGHGLDLTRARLRRPLPVGWPSADDQVVVAGTVD
jgi:hypothetical protein